MARKKPRKRRLIKHLYEPVRHRLEYLCELYFGGDGRAMAYALDLDFRELYRVFRGDIHPTVRMVAHIAVKLDVRVEWLICGVGPVARTGEATDGLQLPVTLQSSFSVFDVTDSSANTETFVSAPKPHKSSDTPPHVQLSQAVYLARSNNKSVGFFLGNDSFAANHVLPFYESGTANVLVTTLGFAATDVRRACPEDVFDINAAARFAANRGIGYGEAIATCARRKCDCKQSILISVHDMRLPALVATEIGEIAGHTAPALHGAETGAAIGAAAYVDLLVLTEQLRSFFTGGVFFLVGETRRGVRLITQQLHALRHVLPTKLEFTFGVFSEPNSEIETIVHHYGGHVLFLNKPTTEAFQQLFQTCNDVYAGKISHEHQ